jgi:uncharacterized iron-regulated protein
MRIAKIITIHLGLFALGIIPQSLSAQSSFDENSAIVKKPTPAKDIQAYQIYTAKGKKISYAQYIEMMGSSIEEQGEKTGRPATVILFGEFHDNPIAHWLQLQTTQDIYAEMKEELDEIAPENKSGKTDITASGQTLWVPLALGAEMFETDQQAALDEYLNPTDTSTKTETMVTPMGAMMGGDPQYDKLKKAVKLWPNFKTDYKPLVDFAKENNLHFIATNIPRKYATLVYRGGLSALDTLPADKKQLFPTMPMPYDSNLNCYAEIFKATGGHGGQNLPMSQAIKDATMAWKIYGNLPSVPEKYEGGSVFIHYNGSYHSDNHESIEWYINQEEKARWSVSRFAVPPQPTKVITISTRTQANVSKLEKENLGIADFIIVTPDNMTKTH